MLDYLKREQARRDVRLLIDAAVPSAGWTAGKRGAWQMVRRESLSVYYQRDKGRFRVSDLGLSVASLRERTGISGSAAQDKISPIRIEMGQSGKGWGAGTWSDLELDGVTDQDLPDAICIVMAAAYLVQELKL